MRKHIYLVGALLALVMNLLSCTSNNDNLTPVLTVTPAKLAFGSDAGTQKVIVKAEFVKWEAKSAEDWISWEISSNSDSEVLVSVKANMLKEKREGTITFSGAGVPNAVVEITQEAYNPKPSLAVDPKALDFAFDGARQVVVVDAQHVDWKVVSSADWLKFEQNPENKSELWVTPQKNESNAKRDATLTFSGEGVNNVVLTVLQQRDFANSPIIWDRNSLHFAKLLGNVSFVDFTDFYGRNVNFDAYGFVKDFIFMMQDEKGQEYEFTVKYEYTADHKIAKIYTQGISVEFIYGSHTNYIEVAKDVFASAGLSQVYLFMPDYIRGVKSIVATHPEAKLTFDFNFTGNQLSVLADDQVWRKIEYSNSFPLKKEYLESGQKKDSAGKVNKYINHIAQEFTFNTSTGKLSEIVTNEEYEFEDKTIPNELSTITYRYLDDKYNNLETEGSTVKYTYDSYGEWDRIVAQTPDFENIDQYQYTRDDKGNWTRRIDKAIFRGEEWNYDDKRTVKYFK